MKRMGWGGLEFIRFLVIPSCGFFFPLQGVWDGDNYIYILHSIPSIGGIERGVEIIHLRKHRSVSCNR